MWNMQTTELAETKIITLFENCSECKRLNINYLSTSN